jgi:hypothetical protein
MDFTMRSSPPAGEKTAASGNTDLKTCYSEEWMMQRKAPADSSPKGHLASSRPSFESPRQIEK